MHPPPHPPDPVGADPEPDDSPPSAAALPLPPEVVETLALLVATPTRRLTTSRLAALLEVPTGALAAIVDRLVHDDLVHRQIGRGDRRVEFAVLTDRGGRVFSEALPQYAASLRADLRSVLQDLVADGADRG